MEHVWTDVRCAGRIDISRRVGGRVDIARMLIGAALLLCILSVPLTGGRLSGLADLEFRRSWLAVAALVVQVLIISILPGGARGLSEEVHLASYLLLGAFLVVNRHIPGLLVIAAGGALNFAAIAANGGVMPADPDAIAAAGIPQDATEFANSAPAAGAAARLPRRRLPHPGLAADPQRLQRRRPGHRGRRLPAPAPRLRHPARAPAAAPAPSRGLTGCDASARRSKPAVPAGSSSPTRSRASAAGSRSSACRCWPTSASTPRGR